MVYNDDLTGVAYRSVVQILVQMFLTKAWRVCPCWSEADTNSKVCIPAPRPSCPQQFFTNCPLPQAVPNDVNKYSLIKLFHQCLQSVFVNIPWPICVYNYPLTNLCIQISLDQSVPNSVFKYPLTKMSPTMFTNIPWPISVYILQISIDQSVPNSV